MEIIIRKFKKEDIKDAVLIWNQVVEDGRAFPQTEFLDEKTGMDFFEKLKILNSWAVLYGPFWPKY